MCVEGLAGLRHQAEEHVQALLQGVGIEGGHDAPLAQVHHTDPRAADAELAALPLPLREVRHAAENEVGPQPPEIAPEGFDRPARRNQQRLDVEAVQAVVPHQPRIRPLAPRTAAATSGEFDGAPSTQGSPSLARNG